MKSIDAQLQTVSKTAVELNQIFFRFECSVLIFDRTGWRDSRSSNGPYSSIQDGSKDFLLALLEKDRSMANCVDRLPVPVHPPHFMSITNSREPSRRVLDESLLYNHLYSLCVMLNIFVMATVSGPVFPPVANAVCMPPSYSSLTSLCRNQSFIDFI